MKVYNTRTHETWSWNFSTREFAQEQIDKHSHNTDHLVVLEDGEEFDEVYIDFGDFCRKEIGMQCQYGSHYLCGLDGYKHHGKGLRYSGSDSSYHDIKIHKDDAKIFKERMMKDMEE
jgi:hypothetical protein